MKAFLNKFGKAFVFSLNEYFSKPVFLTQFRILLKRLSFLLTIYMVLRLAFYVLNYSVFREASIGEVLWAFVIGLKFDLSAICIINLPFILFSLLPFGFTFKKQYQFGLKTWFIVSNFPFICLNLIDLEYFKFIGRRTSNELFTITHDIQEQAAQLILNYWYFPIIGAILVFLFIKGYPELKKNAAPKLNYFTGILGLLATIGVSVFLIRGSLDLKPLRPANAFLQQPAVLGHVSLNSSFTFIKGINDEPLAPKTWFKDQQEIARVLNFSPQLKLSDTVPVNRDNVVILILESFASEYNGIENGGKGYTPFFDSLAAQGAFYRNNFANGRKSIEALPSIFTGLPALMDEPYITSGFQSNTIYGIGTIVKKAGYKTSFFHGAQNGSMGFNTFSGIAGFDTYYGLNEYPKENYKTDFDGQWGILDEPYLQYFAAELSKQPQPFLSSVFTLSSHQPYPVPAKYKGRFPKGDLPIHEAIGYTDFALKQFFKTAAEQPWYKNTLFILVADHTQASSNPAYQNEIGNFRVPLLLFHPGRKIPVSKKIKITQQADIPATIADFLHLPTSDLLPFGQSVLDTVAPGRALFYTNGNYVMVQPDLVTRLNETDEITYYGHYNFKQTPEEVEKRKMESDAQLKAYVQYYRNGLIENTLYFWKKPTPETRKR